MITLEFIDGRDSLDLLNKSITYIKQVGDLGNITTLNSSYSWVFTFPKTSNNTRKMESLGIVGDTSTVPYTKNYVRVLDNGIPIVSKGTLVVNETSDNYMMHVQEGVIDFFKSVGVDKIGETLDLSQLDHENTVANIISSFTRDDYRYIIASYNVAPLPDKNDITNLNTVGLVPSVNLQWLWDKIFAYYGWTYTGNFDFSDLWMTYPSAISFDESEGQNVADVSSTNVEAREGIPSGSQNKIIPWENSIFEPGKAMFMSGNKGVLILQTGNYLIRARVEGSARYGLMGGLARKNTAIYVHQNGVRSTEPITFSNEGEGQLQMELSAGDNVVLSMDCRNGNSNYWGKVEEAEMLIQSLGLVEVSFSEAFIKYKTKDFVKEMTFRGSLTAFPDVESKNIHFLTLDERLSADVVDWSDKYVRRISETYLYESYAQNNFIRHKYDEEGSDYNDGNLRVENENLESEQTLYESQTYAPLLDLVPYNGFNGVTYYVNNFKMFDVEVQQNEAEEIELKYTPLKQRFYVMKSKTKNDRLYILDQLITSFPVAEVSGTSFKDVVGEKFGSMGRMLTDTRVHKIELALSKYDVATLDLKKRYYFKQEANFYLLNNLKYVSGKTCEGEFIRIKNY